MNYVFLVMNLESHEFEVISLFYYSFIIHKTFVDIMFFNTINIECVFRYLNIHQMFSKLFWIITYFIRRATCVYPFRCMYKDCRNPTLGLSVRMQLTFPKVRKWSPSGVLNTQKTIWGVKSLHLGAFFISMESYWSVDDQDGLAWAIWTSTAQVMGKRRAGSQIVSLTPDH
jgi:hypothetical protein